MPAGPFLPSRCLLFAFIFQTLNFKVHSPPHHLCYQSLGYVHQILAMFRVNEFLSLSNTNRTPSLGCVLKEKKRTELYELKTLWEDLCSQGRIDGGAGIFFYLSSFSLSPLFFHFFCFRRIAEEFQPLSHMKPLLLSALLTQPICRSWGEEGGGCRLQVKLCTGHHPKDGWKFPSRTVGE